MNMQAAGEGLADIRDRRCGSLTGERRSAASTAADSAGRSRRAAAERR